MIAHLIVALPSSLLAGIFIFSLPSITYAQTDNGNECSCFRTNSSSAGYFSYHRFFDYRNISSALETIPSKISNISRVSNAVATSDFFLSDAWKNYWEIQNWNNSDTLTSSEASVLMVNSANNIFIEKSNDSDPTYSSYLTLRTARLPDFQSASEIVSTEKNYQYLSARFFARAIGSSGACAGLFTYLPNDNPADVQEADIEILTRDPRNRVQYTNQPSVDTQGNVIPEASVNGTNPDSRDWTQWNVYRVDWMPEMTSWYVNGVSVANISLQTPKDPASLIINMWSDGGPWTGNMSTFDEAYLQIQWIEIAFNTSGPYAGSGSKKRSADGIGAGVLLAKRERAPGCKAVCGIDEKVNVTGTPALLYNNTGLAPVGWKGEGMGALVWIPVVLVGGAAFGLL